MPYEKFGGMPVPQAEKPPEVEEKGKEEAMRVAFETREGEKFFAERLTNPEDPRVEKAHKMLASQFGKKEVDPVEVMKQAMTGKMETGEEVPPYLVNVIENSKGEIKGISTGAVVETVDDKGEVSEKSGVSLGCYVLISPEARGNLKILKELFNFQELSAQRDAESRGLEVKGYIVEAHNAIELILNREGVRRGYVKAKDGSFHELPYEQPPLDWNSKSGKPARGAGIAPEHLMLKLASRENKLSGKELMEMIRGMYYYNNYREEEYFKNLEAYQTHTEFVEGVEQKLADFIGKRQVHLLSRKERENMKKQGIEFIEHRSEEEEEK